tara:strand:- start:149 stop:361 length:213 start_codon:yes stop_codon:yes gene_type:complete
MTTTEKDVLNYVKSRANEFDSLCAEIFVAYELFLTEIEDEGASIAHEAELCIGEIEDLIDEYKSNTTTKR